MRPVLDSLRRLRLSDFPVVMWWALGGWFAAMLLFSYPGMLAPLYSAGQAILAVILVGLISLWDWLASLGEVVWCIIIGVWLILRALRRISRQLDRLGR